MMKTRIKKVFLDINKEEKWLNEQGEQGLMLTAYQNGEYEFENVSPARYQYKIDQPSYGGEKKKDYLAFLEETGISVVAEYGGRVYLRKNEADGPLRIYSDPAEIQSLMAKRYSFFFVIGISQLILGAYMLFYMLYTVESRSVPFWIAVVIDAALILSGIFFLITGIRKRKQYAPPREEENLWEK